VESTGRADANKEKNSRDLQPASEYPLPDTITAAGWSEWTVTAAFDISTSRRELHRSWGPVAVGGDGLWYGSRNEYDM